MQRIAWWLEKNIANTHTHYQSKNLVCDKSTVVPKKHTQVNNIVAETHATNKWKRLKQKHCQSYIISFLKRSILKQRTTWPLPPLEGSEMLFNVVHTLDFRHCSNVPHSQSTFLCQFQHRNYLFPNLAATSLSAVLSYVVVKRNLEFMPCYEDEIPENMVTMDAECS